MGNVMVRNFKCKCGKSRLLSVITETPFDKDRLKEHAALIHAGCDVETITLEVAREKEICTTCIL